MLNITIPHEISYSNQNGRLSLYAVDNTRQEEAHGFNENFFMNGSATTTEADSIGPKIFIYLNTPDFPNGGYVKSDALLIATLSDSAGINTVKNSVGHALELVLDNQQGTPILTTILVMISEVLHPAQLLIRLKVLLTESIV